MVDGKTQTFHILFEGRPLEGERRPSMSALHFYISVVTMTYTQQAQSPRFNLSFDGQKNIMKRQ